MRFAIVYSKQNIAGTNIILEFKKLGFLPQIPIIELKKETLYADDLNPSNYPELKNIDFIVFASTHRSEKGDPSLSVHAPGNFRGGDLGGKPGKVSMTSAYVCKYLFKELYKNANANKIVSEKYKLTLEVTHHGPTIDIPCCYIELGSSENEWNDLEGAGVVAKSILSLDKYSPDDSWIPAIGIGGPHYAPNFNKIQLKSKYAIGHIIPEYMMPITDMMLRETEKKTSEQIKEILIDWKGCGKSEDRSKLLLSLNLLGYKYKRTSDIEK